MEEDPIKIVENNIKLSHKTMKLCESIVGNFWELEKLSGSCLLTKRHLKPFFCACR